MCLKSDLQKKIIDATNSYEKGTNLLHDETFDSIIAEYSSLYPEDDFLDKISFSKNKKIRHEYEMLSLQKITDLKELLKWTSKGTYTQYVVTPKIDGLALELVYYCTALSENEATYTLKIASTRGDGEYGEDVYPVVQYIRNIPKVMRGEYLGPKVVVKGEAYMENATFEKLLETNNDYISPRNLVAGTLNTKGDNIKSVIEERDIKFFPYNLNCENKNKYYANNLSRIASMMNLTVILDKVYGDSVDTIIEKYKETRKDLPMNIDGIVIRFNEEEKYDREGSTAHHPKGAVAYKFESEKNTSILRNIAWQVSKVGVLTPVAEFDPVEISGAIISRATLHNVSYVEEHKLMIGDKIEVSRRGDIIPKVLKNLSAEGRQKYDLLSVLAKECPCCGGDTTLFFSENGIKNIKCMNKDCSDRLFTNIYHFARVMNIEGLGKTYLKELVDLKIVTSIESLYELDRFKLGKVSKLEGLNGKKILNEIEKSKTVEFWRLLYALGIDGIGEEMSKEISTKKTFAEIVECVEHIEKGGDCSALHRNLSLGVATRSKFLKGILARKDTILKLKNIITIAPMRTMPVFAQSHTSPIAGLSFIITGALSKPKQYFYSLIESRGGVVAAGVTKKLDYLIYGSEDSTSSKMMKAKSLGVKTITEQELMEMLK